MVLCNRRVPAVPLSPHRAAKLGHHCPPHTNIADHALDLTAVDTRSRDSDVRSRARVEALIAAWRTQRDDVDVESRLDVPRSEPTPVTGCAASPTHLRFQIPAACNDAREADSTRQMASAGAFTTVVVLVVRSTLNLARTPRLVLSRVLQVAAFAGLLALFFSPLPTDQSGVQNRLGLIYQSSSVVFIGMLNCVSGFPIERDVFRREHADGLYGPISFLIA